MNFGRHFADYQPLSDDELEETETTPITLKIRKGGRAGRSKLYRFFSHPAVVTSLLSAIHLLLLIPGILSLITTRITYEEVYWLRNHFVATCTLIGGIYLLLLIVFSAYDFYLRRHPKASFDASASIVRIYGCRGVHPRILLTIFLCIEVFLLLVPILANLDLNKQLVSDKIIQASFGPIPPEVLKTLRTVGFDPGLYLLPGDFSVYGWHQDRDPPYSTYKYKTIKGPPPYPNGDYPKGYSGDGVRPWTPDLAFDIYFPNSTKPVPIIFYIHGGDWRLGDKSHTPLVIDYWLSKGYAFVSPQYRLLSHGYLVWDMVEDLSAAYRYILEDQNFTQLNKQAWVFVGEDAGGHLAASTAYSLNDHSRIKGVINFFGLTLLDYYLQQNYDQRREIVLALIGGNASRAFEGSATSFLNNTSGPSTLSLHGQSDSIVPYSLAEEFHEELDKQYKTEQLLLGFQTYDHGLVGSFYSHATQLSYFAMEHFLAQVTTPKSATEMYQE